jgi:hypothetical protein
VANTELMEEAIAGRARSHRAVAACAACGGGGRPDDACLKSACRRQQVKIKIIFFWKVEGDAEEKGAYLACWQVRI